MLTGEGMIHSGPLHKMLSEVLEGEIELPSERAPDRDIPKGLEEICLRCVARDPNDRYQSANGLILAERDVWPGILFLPVDEPKPAKNRLHIDLRPDDQAAEVERLIALGAKRVDIGQGDASWVVLADPEGNEFCVLSNG